MFSVNHRMDIFLCLFACLYFVLARPTSWEGFFSPLIGKVNFTFRVPNTSFFGCLPHHHPSVQFLLSGHGFTTTGSASNRFDRNPRRLPRISRCIVIAVMEIPQGFDSSKFLHLYCTVLLLLLFFYFSLFSLFHGVISQLPAECP